MRYALVHHGLDHVCRAPLVPSRWTEFFKGWNANTTRMHARDYHGPEGPVAEAEGWLASKDGKSTRAPVCLSPPRHASRLASRSAPCTSSCTLNAATDQSRVTLSLRVRAEFRAACERASEPQEGRAGQGRKGDRLQSACLSQTPKPTLAGLSFAAFAEVDKFLEELSTARPPSCTSRSTRHCTPSLVIGLPPL